MDEILPRLFTPALVNLLLAATALVLFNDWRIRLTALAVQYTTAAILITQVVVPEVAIAKFVVGCLVVAILVITAAQLNFGQVVAGGPAAVPLVDADSSHSEVPTGLPFRLLAALMFIIASVYLATQPNRVLPGLEVAPAITIPAYLLIALGLLNLGLSDEPMRAGTGLLTLMLGFEIFYAAVEPSLAVTALLAASQFGVALAISFLTTLQQNLPEDTVAD
jgi:hypothetical protein